HGTFYAFPEISGLIERLPVRNDVELTRYLLEQVGVALVPGSAFGSPGYMRLSFATSMANLDEALDRLEKVK
ncbi:MAG TPA: aminotransferase class I/II-fold pyridoxal phosphate-dependent enzyme, partial [Gammaproteobacteria bacterium]|nr:aminotransferase class I/II-fold pyridoxal phosphate-dependent enzyme [Gammaproteobacteria bacterium]